MCPRNGVCRLGCDSEADADDDQGRRDALPCETDCEPDRLRYRKVFGTHINLDGHHSNNRLRGMLNREQDDEDELDREVQRAALDDDAHRVACGAPRAEGEARVGDLERRVPDAHDDERGDEHVCAERERVARNAERHDLRGGDGCRRVDGEQQVHNFHQACCGQKQEGDQVSV